MIQWLVDGGPSLWIFLVLCVLLFSAPFWVLPWRKKRAYRVMGELDEATASELTRYMDETGVDRVSFAKFQEWRAKQ